MSLLKKNDTKLYLSPKVKSENRKLHVNQDLEYNLLLLATQKPNKKAAGTFNLSLSIYNVFKTEKTKGLSYWIMTHLGEEPVIFDEQLISSTEKQMFGYLYNRGFMNATVSDTFFTKRQRTTVVYYITPGTLYLIDSIYLPPKNSGVQTLVNEFETNSTLIKGNPFDADVIDAERLRLTNELKNWGYYKFKPDYIYFQADTTGKKGNTEIHIKIVKPQANEQDKFFIKNIFVYPNFDQSLLLTTQKQDTISYNNYIFIADTFKVKPEVIETCLFLYKNDKYSLQDYNYTIHRLNELGVFKFISIQFKEVGHDSLNCFIKLTPSKRQQISADVEAENIENSIGNALSTSYLNRNMNHSSTSFQLGLNGNTQIPVFSADSLIYNLNANMNLAFHRLVIPFKIKNISRRLAPVTRFSLSSKLLTQTSVYSLLTYNFTYGIEFHNSLHQSHLLNPVSISLVKVPFLSPSFRDKINADPFLKQSFSDQLITGITYVGLFTNQNDKNVKNTYYFRTAGELSGPVLYSFYKLLDVSGVNTAKDNEGHYSVSGLNFSTYFKADADFRYYFKFRNLSSLIFRTELGLSYIPSFMNSDVLPITKQFYGGGPGSIRCYRVRALGPGSYFSGSNHAGNQLGFFNQTGDMKFEFNAEYRFPIFSYFKGALFADGGNIWTERADTSKPGAEFRFVPKNGINFSSFHELALGTGVGLRADFSYFIFRFDFAFPLRDPSLLPGNAWIDQSHFMGKTWIKNNLVLNLAIGYPF